MLSIFNLLFARERAGVRRIVASACSYGIMSDESGYTASGFNGVHITGQFDCFEL